MLLTVLVMMLQRLGMAGVPPYQLAISFDPVGPGHQ